MPPRSAPVTVVAASVATDVAFKALLVMAVSTAPRASRPSRPVGNGGVNMRSVVRRGTPGSSAMVTNAGRSAGTHIYTTTNQLPETPLVRRATAAHKGTFGP